MDINNIFTIFFLSFFLLSVFIKLFLDLLNYKHRKKNLSIIPVELKGSIDKKKLILINSYTNEKTFFSLIEYFSEKILLIIVLFAGIIPFYYNILSNITMNNYLIVLYFFGSFYIAQTLFDIPFSLYYNFKIEKKYNFNKMTVVTWAGDFIKQLLISIFIFSIIFAVLVFLISTFVKIWWFLLWGFLFLFSLTMQIIYPSFIAPLFNKFEPLKNKKLKKKIEKLLNDSGFKSDGVFQMDASKRSSHSNAYFTGIGKTKRIVLFDSLLEKHTEDEILSILAHEVGHFKHKHILKGMILSTFFSLIALFAANFFMNEASLYRAFGFNSAMSVDKLKFIGLFLIVIISAPVAFLINPFSSWLSRKHEYQADLFASKTIKTSKPLISALKKLNLDNLSNIFPASLYEWFYYSHPSLFKRIRAIKKYAE